MITNIILMTSCSAIGGSALQCWDNTTRGLDSSTALDFVRTLRTSTMLTGATALVTVYQASQSIYDASMVLDELYSYANVKRSSIKFLFSTKVARSTLEASILRNSFSLI